MSSAPPRVPGGGMVVLPGGVGNSKYDEAEFLVGGKGKSPGETVTIPFRLHEGYATEITRWLLSKKFPYRSVTDLVRHAIVRHLRYFLPAMEGEVEGTLLHEMAQIDELVARWRIQNDMMQQIEAVSAEVTRTLQMPNGRQEVERMLRVLRRMIDGTKHGFFKLTYQKMFNDRFGAYLNRIALAKANYGTDDSGVVEFPIQQQDIQQHAYDDDEE